MLKHSTYKRAVIYCEAEWKRAQKATRRSRLFEHCFMRRFRRLRSQFWRGDEVSFLRRRKLKARKVHSIVFLSRSMATQSQPVMSADETMSLPCFISPRASPWANPRNHISCQHTRSCCSIFCSIYFMNCIISQLHTVTVGPHSTTRLIYLSFC